MYKKFLFLISFVIVLSMAYTSYGDAYPPLPNDAGMIWKDPPVATSPTTIVMACVDACDVNDPICTYNFTCTTDAGKSSGWQLSPYYEAAGLTPKTKYTFNVQAKDANGTTNDASYNVSATTDDTSTPPVLRLDLNVVTDNNDANTQTSFIRYTIQNNGTDINGVITDFTVSTDGMGINPARRDDPCGAWNEYELHGLGNGSGDPCYFLGRGGERLYRDFFSAYGSTTDGFTITLWGLGVNQDCNIMMWAYDAKSLKSNDVNRVAHWYANGSGTPIFDTNFAGGSASYPRYLDSVGGSNDLYRFAFKGRATADSLGRIVLTSTRYDRTTAAEPFCFVNALKIEPNMIKSDGSPYTFAATHYAYRPIPASGVAGCVDVNTQLKWHNGAGIGLTGTHDLYLGTNSNDVNTASRTSHPNVLVCKLDQSYDANKGVTPIANGFLALDTTYYWKVDENDNPTLYRGENWHFATCPNHVIDDFDEYAPPAGPPDMEKVWNDYWYQSPPLTCCEVFPDNNAGQLHLRGTTCSMQYHFENASFDPYYSEARASVDTARPLGLGMTSDWLGMNAKSLSLWFYGQAGNDASQKMYVTLTDGASNFKQVYYDGDMNDIKVASWHEWDILLSAFTGVDLSNVKTMTLGFGNGTQASTDGIVWFDDFQIYATRCALSKRDPNFAIWDYAPLGNPGGDCVVDYQEIQAMSTVWLNRDLVIETNKPGDSNLVIWYPLDENVTMPDVNVIWNHLDTNHPDVCDATHHWDGTLWNNTIGAEGTPLGAANPPGYYGTSFSQPGYNGTGSCIYMDGTQGGRVQCGPRSRWNQLRLGIGSGKYYATGDVNAMTLSAWVKWLGSRTWDSYLASKCQGVLGKRGGWDDQSMVWMLELDTNGSNRSIGIRHYATGDTATPDLYAANNLMNQYVGQWVHIAVTFPNPAVNTADANSHAHIYLNGGQVADGPWRFSQGPDANIYLTIGETQDQNAWVLCPESYYGYIDDVRIYNRALDINEIGYLADPTPNDWLLWVPIPSPSDVWKDTQGNGVVNFKDFAMVAIRWLNEDMYP